MRDHCSMLAEKVHRIVKYLDYRGKKAAHTHESQAEGSKSPSAAVETNNKSSAGMT